MAQIPNTKIYLNKQQQEEFDRFAAASARLVERARQDKNVALQFLKDIDYFEIMAAEAAEQAAAEAAQNGKVKTKSVRGKTAKGSTAVSKRAKAK